MSNTECLVCCIVVTHNWRTCNFIVLCDSLKKAHKLRNHYFDQSTIHLNITKDLLGRRGYEKEDKRKRLRATKESEASVEDGRASGTSQQRAT